jgi:peptidoglycan hydrolase CwlO-like protein
MMKKKFNLSLITLIVGVVVATGITVAGAIILNDKRSRDKIEGIGNSIKSKAKAFVKGIQNKVLEKKDEIGKQLTKGKEKIAKLAHETSEILDDKAGDIKNVAHIQ